MIRALIKKLDRMWLEREIQSCEREIEAIQSQRKHDHYLEQVLREDLAKAQHRMKAIAASEMEGA
jgi:hypothetical protein